MLIRSLILSHMINISILAQAILKIDRVFIIAIMAESKRGLT